MNKRCKVKKPYNGLKEGDIMVFDPAHARGISRIGLIEILGDTNDAITPYPSSEAAAKLERKPKDKDKDKDNVS